MQVSEFNYKLPSDLIAIQPLDNRSDSKLLVVDRASKKIFHKKFIEIIDYLKKGDCLVLNNTKVIPARLIGNIEKHGRVIEILLIKEIDSRDNIWEIIAKPSKKLKVSSMVFFGNGELTGEVVKSSSNGIAIIRFHCSGSFYKVLEKSGNMPLPPYILKRRKAKQNHYLMDKERYQTVFANVLGSIAAPTAGLHFTDETINLIKHKGIRVVEITLHIGIGTFKPIRAENIEEHKMDEEHFEISHEVDRIISDTKKRKNKIICVGSTVTRALEFAYLNPAEPKLTGLVDIFIYPGFKFNVVDCLLTNFHLPVSTPLLLVSAFAGKDLIFYAYDEAIKNNYRFLSYGDAMLILDLNYKFMV